MDKQVEKAMKAYADARKKLESMREQTARWLAERGQIAARLSELSETKLAALMAEDGKRAEQIDKDTRSVQHRLSELDAMIERREVEAHAAAAQLWEREGRALATAWQKHDEREAAEAIAEIRRLEPAWIAAMQRWERASQIGMTESVTYPANSANVKYGADFAAWWTSHVIGRNGGEPEPEHSWLLRGTKEGDARPKLIADVGAQDREQLAKLQAAKPQHVTPSRSRVEDKASSIPDIAPVLSDEGYQTFDTLL